MFLILFCSCLCSIHWSQMLSQKWSCSWSSATGVAPTTSEWSTILQPTKVSYIRGLTVHDMKAKHHWFPRWQLALLLTHWAVMQTESPWDIMVIGAGICTCQIKIPIKNKWHRVFQLFVITKQSSLSIFAFWEAYRKTPFPEYIYSVKCCHVAM